MEHTRISTLSENVTARLMKNVTTLNCGLCEKDINIHVLCIGGGSFSGTRGYIGGFYHLPCWRRQNFHLLNERIIKMAEKQTNTLKTPSIKPIGDVPGIENIWDLKHSDVVDKLIVIHSFERIKTSFGSAFVAQCDVDGERKSVLIGAQVLMDKLVIAEQHMPISATVTYNGTYYNFI